MIRLINCSVDEFKKNIKQKKIYLFGAGRRAIHLCEIFHIEKCISKIIDNNTELHGKTLEICQTQIEIISLNEFMDECKLHGKYNIQLIITSAFYAWDIINQLNEEDELDELICYDMNLLMDFYEKKSFDFTKGKQLIPKKLHYCWFGKTEIPDKLKKCIESWSIYCSDYEIIRWDESNYDITKNRYMREAYECSKWGFVSDYARLDIIYHEGGIYLDTDVELIASLDPLLNDEVFMGADSNMIINSGQGFGARQGNFLIKRMLDYYKTKRFIKENGDLNLTPCYMYQHPVLIESGLRIENRYQKQQGAVIYPSEVSAPTGRCGIFHNFTDKTVSIHHNEFSWIDKTEYQHLQEYKKNILKYLQIDRKKFETKK